MCFLSFALSCRVSVKSYSFMLKASTEKRSSLCSLIVKRCSLPMRHVVIAFSFFFGAVKCRSLIGPAPACAHPIGLFLLVFCPVIGDRFCSRPPDWSRRRRSDDAVGRWKRQIRGFPSSLYGECWIFNTARLVGAVHSVFRTDSDSVGFFRLGVE